ncbi:MAG TPA: hypothetical protein VNB59_06305 [Solirubrobacterales bacterium]|jgi:hypothetical protein|nr:hypothetical protein [Solirubrobacterales bacterium]
MRKLALIFGVTAGLLAGASSASATTLCNEAANPCPEGRRYNMGTTIKMAQKAKVKLEMGGLGNLECNKSNLEGATTANSGNPLTGEASSFTLKECDLNGVRCANDPAGVGTNWVMNVEWGAVVGNGTWKLKKHLGGVDPGFSVNCQVGGVIVNCTFSKVEWILTTTGGNPAILSMVKAVMNRAGLACPANAELTVEYEVTEPKPLFISKEP